MRLAVSLQRSLAFARFLAKERKYADHPVGDEFVPLAVDVHGAFGAKWLDWLHRLAQQAAARRHGQQGEQPGFNVAGSLAQVFRMRLAVSLQRSLAFARFLAKERKYADHPVGDEFVPLAVDVHGAFGAKWLDWLHRLAQQAAARRHGQQGEQPGFNVAGSLAQVFRMRLAVSLQRSLAFARFLAKERKYADHPVGDEFVPLAVDVHGAFGAKWLDWLHRLAQQAAARRHGQQGEQPGFNVAGSLAQVFRMRLAVSLQRSLAFARFLAKERKYADHPVGDEFVPLAVDVHGAFGAKWLDWLHRLAQQAAARRHGQQGEQPGFNVAGSLAQVFRMRLAVSLQRSLAFARFLAKERKYADHPVGDEFVPLAVDVHGAFGAKWLDWLHRLAQQAAARRHGQQGEQPGFNVAGSLAQVFRMRLAVSLQRSLAFARFLAKERKYADHPVGDEFVPLAVDVHGAFGAKWLDWLHRLAQQAAARRHGQQGEQPGFNVAGSLAQVFRMRLAVSLQRSLAFARFLAKERKYADHPVGDEFVPLAVDVHGAFGAKWLDWLHRLAQQAAARRHGQQGEQPGFNVAGSLAQVFRMRLAVSLQRSLAFARFLAKERKYADHPVGDEFVPLAVDVHGAFGAKWLDWLHRLAQQAAARRHGQQGEQPGFNVAGSLAQVFRMRLAVSLQRSLAFARFLAKERKYADHPVGDEFVPLAVDVHGAFGAKWLDWLHRLAQQAAARRHGQQGEQPGFNVAGSLAQVFRMRLAVSLQ
eukprot:SM000353S13172  [mRNA]  locus=s353:50351:58312:- [translate_table: standard]